MVYFDQPGCGKSIECLPTEENTITTFANLLNSLSIDKDYNLILHSWGTYIAGKAISLGLLDKKPKKIIFINPAPFSKKGIDTVFNKLLDRVPDEVMSKIERFRSEGSLASGKKIMEMALPYYTGSDNIPDIDVDYNIATGTIVGDAIGEYDFNSVFDNLKESSLYVFGKNDYIESSDIDIIDATVLTKTMSGGHFAFAEYNDEFCNIVKDFLTKKKRTIT